MNKKLTELKNWFDFLINNRHKLTEDVNEPALNEDNSTKEVSVKAHICEMRYIECERRGYCNGDC